MWEGSDEFRPPPEAPIFEPTAEEFEDPLSFIAKIRPEAEKYGICKVRPPPEWQPPFAVDVETFRFVPRMQKINELEATMRVKLNFLDKLLKFWELQGLSIKIPMVDEKLLDFHRFHTIVKDEGGYDDCTQLNKWSKVASLLHLHSRFDSELKSHYEKYLYPFDVFQAGVTVDHEAVREEMKREEAASPNADKSDPSSEPPTTTTQVTDTKPTLTTSADATVVAEGASNVPSATASSSALSSCSESSVSSLGAQRGRKRKDAVEKSFAKITKSPKKEKNSGEPDIDYSANNELRKLQFFGAGPKTVVPHQISKGGSTKTGTIAESEPPPPPEPSVQAIEKRKMRDRSANWRPSYLENEVCVQCDMNTNEFQMLTCDSCSDVYHTYCLLPPLSEAPKGDWRCPKCVAKECSKPKAVYGFEQAKRDFSLQEFGEMADQFKTDYFQMPVHKVPSGVVEKEFWRLTRCIEDDLTVHYGADIHALINGSGFPVKTTANLKPHDEKYVKSGWNLMNLPVYGQSVLKYVTGDVSGMKVPWCYVGMCFSSFCWHIEDHWSYSINYMHWGEPKTWYGVPSTDAELLENVMKSRAPELFEQSPDLLHHITTILNPNELMDNNIKVVRTDQCAGEFIITFPRAYHAGFNQGYNFAEAVNFCPSDWMPFGRGCIQHYKTVKRQCVFSHEELVCKMAAETETLDIQTAAQTHNELVAIVEYERGFRRRLLKKGVTQAERAAFELSPDDERQCCYCKTTCFMSAVTCPCRPDVVVCPEHDEELCDCHASRKVLRYRYTLDEIPSMIMRLKRRAQSYQEWTKRAAAVLEAPEDGKLCRKASLDDFRDLVHEAKESRYPSSNILLTLERLVKSAEHCCNLANQLVSRPLKKSRSSDYCCDARRSLNIDEIENFHKVLLNLACEVPETQLLKKYLDRLYEFRTETQNVINEMVPPIDKVSRLYEFGLSLNLGLKEVAQLKQALAQAHWLEKVDEQVNELSPPSIDGLKSLIKEGGGLSSQQTVDTSLEKLRQLLVQADKLQDKATIVLQSRPRHVISTLENILTDSRQVTVTLPSVDQVRSVVEEARTWMKDYDKLTASDNNAYLDYLEELINRGRPMSVRLEPLAVLESQVTAAKSWRERTARAFLKKQSTYTLLEVLTPRRNIGVYPGVKGAGQKKRAAGKDKDAPGIVVCNPLQKHFVDPSDMVIAFKTSEHQEIEAMMAMRAKNSEKNVEDRNEPRFCQCRKAASGLMFQCELCKEWFHSACVPMGKPANPVKGKPNETSWLQAAKDTKFLCPYCLRSRRPKLETILSLLVGLQKLPVRLSEGEALQCLTERAMEWQERARQSLSTEQLSMALTKLSTISQRMSEQAAREKTEKIINAELQKAASNPDLPPISHTLYTQKAVSSSSSGSRLTVPPTTVMNRFEPIEIATSTVTIENKPADVSEHAYSSASKNSNKPPASPSHTEGSEAVPRKHQRKSPLVPRSTGSPPPALDLPDMLRAELEELMMEGDLLEVSLDETQHIWRILQACYARQGADNRVVQLAHDPAVDAYQKGAMLRMKKEKKKKQKQQASQDMAPKHTREIVVQPPSFTPPVVQNPVLPAKPAKKRKSTDVAKPKPAKAAKMTVALPIMTLNSSTPDKKSPKVQKKKKVKKMKLSAAADDLKRIAAAETAGALVVDTSTGQLEEEEDCSAPTCRKPVGDEVDWVQCDKCELWFHLVCLGLSKSQVDESVDFVCKTCQAPEKVGPSGAAGDSKPMAEPASNSSSLTSVKEEPKYSPPNVPSQPPSQPITEEEIISVVGTPTPSASQSPVDNGMDTTTPKPTDVKTEPAESTC